MKTLKVSNTWQNDAGDVLIVHLVPLDENRKLRNDLFWFSGNDRPNWRRGMEITDEDVLGTKCYKQRTLNSISEDIPNDCFMSF